MSVYDPMKTLIFTGGNISSATAVRAENAAADAESSAVSAENEADRAGSEADRSEAEADRAEAAADAASGFTYDDLPSLLADTRTIPVGSVVDTKAEHYSYDVVDSDPHLVTAGGTMLRVSEESVRVTPRMFGAVGDGVADDLDAVQASWVFGGENKIPVHMEGLEYNCSEAVNTVSNLTVMGQGAVMYITEWPAVGGFVNNVWQNDPVRRVQSNIRIHDLITDGSKLPPPDETQNTNLGPSFARGASNVRVVDCTARYMRRGYGGGSGGGGLGGEQGLQDVIFSGCRVHDCYRGIRVAGVPGNHGDVAGEAKNAIGVVFRDTTIERCGAAIFCHSIGHAGDNSSNLAVFDALFDGAYINNCGHQAWSDVDYSAHPNVVPQKSGVIVFAGAQNIMMKSIRVRIETGYTASTDWLGQTGYPASGTNYAGAGLSGPVGAVIWGWGRNITIQDLTLDGTVDSIRRIARAVALGEIASIPPGDETSPNAQNEINVRHVKSGGEGPIGSVIDGWRTSGGVGPQSAHTEELIRYTDFAAPSIGIVNNSAIPSGGLDGLNRVYLEYGNFRGQTNMGSTTDWIADPSTFVSGAIVSYKGPVISTDFVVS